MNLDLHLGLLHWHLHGHGGISWDTLGGHARLSHHLLRCLRVSLLRDSSRISLLLRNSRVSLLLLHHHLRGVCNHHLRCLSHCNAGVYRHLDCGNNVDWDNYSGLEVGRGLESVAPGSHLWKNSQRDSGSRGVGAASAALVLSADSDEVFILDDETVCDGLGLTHHEGVLGTVGLLNAVPGSRGRRVELDCVKVNSDEPVLVVGLLGGNALLVLLSESEHLEEYMATGIDSNLLLDSKSNARQCKIALLV